MRDAEFSKIYIELSPRLEKFFRDRMKKPVARGDKALMAEDLVQLTAMLALENSRKPQYQDYSIKKLLFEKAKNVWADYVNPPKKAIRPEDMAVLAEEASDSPSQLQRLINLENIGNIQKMADEKTWRTIKLQSEGYNNQEISEELNETEENLRQKISRLRAKIKMRWKDRGLL